MNLFYLDSDLDKCAEYHVDRHVNKMILEAAQLICTNLWIDHLFGFVPRAITKEENAILQTTRKEWNGRPSLSLPPYHAIAPELCMGTLFPRKLLLDKLLCVRSCE